MKRLLLVASMTLLFPAAAHAGFWDWFQRPLSVPTTTPEVIKVPDQSLVSANDSLAKEVADLKAKVESLTNQLAQCQKPVASTPISNISVTPATSSIQYSELQTQKDYRSQNSPVIYTSSQKIKDLQEKIIGLKNDYYKSYQDINYDPNYSGDTKVGLQNNLLNETNMKIDQVNLQIQQIQLDDENMSNQQKPAPAGTTQTRTTAGA